MALVRSIVERTSLERVTILPSDVGGSLAQALGELNAMLGFIQTIADALKIGFPLVEYREQLAENAENLKYPVRSLRPYFKWFGKQSGAANDTITNPSLGEIDSITGDA